MTRALMMLICGCASLSPQYADAAAAGEAPGKVTGERSPIVGVRVALGMPKPISIDEFELYCWIMELTEAQKSVFQSMYDQFLVEDVEFRKRRIAPLLKRAGEISPQQGALESDPEAAAQVKPLFDERERVMRELAALEHAFLIRLEPLLAEHQQPKIIEAWQARERTQARGFPPGNYPGWSIDLVVMLHDLHIDGFLEASHEACRPLLTNYSGLATGTLKACTNETIKSLHEGREFEVEMYPRIQVDPNDPDRVAKYMAAYEELAEHRRRNMARKLDLAKQCLDLNVQYLQRLKPLLPSDAARELQRRFDEKAYRHVYPDEADIHNFCMQVQGIAGLTVEQQGQLNEVVATYAAAWQQISAEMVREYMKWMLSREQTNSYIPTEFWAYQDRLRASNKRRAEQALATLNGFRTILSAGQMSLIEDDFDVVEAAVRFAIESPAAPERPW